MRSSWTWGLFGWWGGGIDQGKLAPSFGGMREQGGQAEPSYLAELGERGAMVSLLIRQNDEIRWPL